MNEYVGGTYLNFYRRILAGFGYDKLRIYSGSFIDWVRNGGEVIKGRLGETEVRVDIKDMQ